MRMAPVYDERRLIKTPLEEFLIGLDDEASRNASIRIREHTVGGDDGEAFDETISHGGPFPHALAQVRPIIFA